MLFLWQKNFPRKKILLVKGTYHSKKLDLKKMFKYDMNRNHYDLKEG
jgi:hypothetical protein